MHLMCRKVLSSLIHFPAKVRSAQYVASLSYTNLLSHLSLMAKCRKLNLQMAALSHFQLCSVRYPPSIFLLMCLMSTWNLLAVPQSDVSEMVFPSFDDFPPWSPELYVSNPQDSSIDTPLFDSDDIQMLSPTMFPLPWSEEVSIQERVFGRGCVSQ